MKRPLTHLGTTPSGKKIFLEKLPHEYPRFSKNDHLYAAVIHGANRTRGGAVANLHRLAAGEDALPHDPSWQTGPQKKVAHARVRHSTKKPPSWKQIAEDYKRRARAAKAAGGKVVHEHGAILVLPTEGSDEYYFEDWQADELIDRIKRENGKVLDYISLEDLILAQSQNW